MRHAQILERGEVETKLLAKHRGRTQKLSIEPGSPHIFYTCGEDGMVQRINLLGYLTYVNVKWRDLVILANLLISFVPGI